MPATVRIVRFKENPIVTPALLGDNGHVNINGPSLIRVPVWVDKPLGRYYLYFADHGGKYIKLAYADDLHGPWKIREGGTLRLEQATACAGHIASPDVIVDAGGAFCRRSELHHQRIRQQYYAALAYGYKQMMVLTFVGGGWSNFFDADGNATAALDDLAALNREVQARGPTLVRMISTDIRITSRSAVANDVALGGFYRNGLPAEWNPKAGPCITSIKAESLSAAFAGARRREQDVADN